ncbi:hypothetical protein HFX_0071 [Haloferax mediterranei ATCC 33500]|uniref:Uncharacterized protein n=1 Tax=Haloferax mediterranei (strain ATCC 33500 / DSM 1411 / JCM 8866 / NBRC 14739 / NCIMB 2177 / R-4) TaxID=523841 RepID=I3R0Q3_HALMT|nr:hypothetical protein HFX_0071 [Haloferax mediterranei ATCC 33500]
MCAYSNTTRLSFVFGLGEGDYRTLSIRNQLESSVTRQELYEPTPASGTKRDSAGSHICCDINDGCNDISAVGNF